MFVQQIYLAVAHAARALPALSTRMDFLTVVRARRARGAEGRAAGHLAGPRRVQRPVRARERVAGVVEDVERASTREALQRGGAGHGVRFAEQRQACLVPQPKLQLRAKRDVAWCANAERVLRATNCRGAHPHRICQLQWRTQRSRLFL